MEPSSDFHTRLTDYELAENLRKLEVSLEVAAQRIERLLQTAFRGGKPVTGRFFKLVADRGPDDALAIAEGHGSLPRALFLGRLQGGRLLERRQRQNAEEALRQLSPALQSWQELKDARNDVRAARLQMIESRDEARLLALGEERGRPRGQAMGHRRGRKT
jgi:DNA helicase HerA-like ATPase